MPKPLREVIHETKFDEEFAQFEPDAEIREEVIMGIDWTLSRNPQTGAITEGRGVWIRELGDPARKRRFWLFYTFNENVVILLSIRPCDPFQIWYT